jgi:lipoprotein-releasing system permease protein
MVGLTLSSLSLLVLQSTMRGLQHNLIEKSKKATGFGTVYFSNIGKEEKAEINSLLKDKNIQGHFELHMEMLLRQGNYISPVIVHGVEKDSRPKLLNEFKLSGAVIGVDLFYKLRMDIDAPLVLISPAHTNSLLQDVPRYITTHAEDVVTTNVPEVDIFHVWADIRLLQNLIREQSYNRYVLTNSFDKNELAQLLSKYNPSINSWEDEHQELVFALRLENTVMIFLFIIMTFLVAICITSGQVIYYDSQKIDYIGLWILGKSLKDLMKMAERLMHLISLFSIALGLVLGTLLLFFIDKYSALVMPAVFVERKIPVDFNVLSYCLSLLIPFGISWLFTKISLKAFKDQSKSFLNEVRSLS